MEERTLPKLRVRREAADQKIKTRIEAGQLLRERKIDLEDELENAREDFRNWSEYNEKLLLQLFGNSSVANEYKEQHGSYEAFDYGTPLAYEIDHFRRGLTTKIKRLDGIREQLDLYDEPSDAPQRTSGSEDTSHAPKRTYNNEAFIVHGRNDEAKLKLARFMEKLGIEATILHEQPNKGQTIIEKFEAHAQEAGFAIVLLTPDDVGGPQENANEAKPRARQNVILELGYFLARIGRERVCVLYKEEVELPSDMHGILYVPMDSADGWQLKLAKEMKQAGLPIDPEKLLLK